MEDLNLAIRNYIEATSVNKITNLTLEKYKGSMFFSMRVEAFLNNIEILRSLDKSKINQEKQYKYRELLIKLLNKIEDYTLTDVSAWMSSELKESKKFEGNYTLVHKHKKSSSSSAIVHNILRQEEQFEKNKNFSISINTEDEKETEQNLKQLPVGSKIIFVDDFTGTGKTVEKIFKKINKYKLDKKKYKYMLLTYYITASALEALKRSDIEVVYKYEAEELADEEIVECCRFLAPEVEEKYIANMGAYAKNTLVSEELSSPNNNFSYLFYFLEKNKKIVWQPFLYRRSNYEFKEKLYDRYIKKKILKMFEPNNELVNLLKKAGHETKEQRTEFYKKFILSSNLSATGKRGEEVDEKIKEQLRYCVEEQRKKIKYPHDRDKSSQI